jgi:hypothetical protein
VRCTHACEESSNKLRGSSSRRTGASVSESSACDLHLRRFITVWLPRDRLATTGKYEGPSTWPMMP